jgi:hypothetical protein
MKTFIITPSCINSKQRNEFAQKSFSCIYDILGEEYPFIVVDDIPRFSKSIFKHIPNPIYFYKSQEIYNKPNVHLVRQYGKGSRLATLRAVKIAKEMGADLVFIHLDDNIYIPIFKKLMHYANDAFKQDKDLMAIKLTDDPILSKFCDSEHGNLTQLSIQNSKLNFDHVVLHPTRFSDYTLWWSYYDEAMIKGKYWPISLWSAIYRVDFLEKLLDIKELKKSKNLVDAEIYYRNPENWARSLKRNIEGKLGYINMQFCGIEMQNNIDWKALIQYPNSLVR